LCHAVGIFLGYQICGVEDSALDPQPVVRSLAISHWGVVQDAIVGIDHALNLGSFSYWVKKSASLCHLDDFSIDGSAQYRTLPRLEIPVETLEEISESFHTGMALIYRQGESVLHKTKNLLFHAILVNTNIFSLAIGENDVLEESLFEIHGRRKPFAIGANFRFQAHHVKLKVPTSHHSLDDVCKTELTPAGQEHGERIFLLHAECHKMIL
jgi:hypothetical protein